MNEMASPPTERTIKGVKFSILKFTIAQWAELESWIKNKLTQEARERMGLCGPDDQELRSKVLSELLDELKEFSLATQSAQRIISTTEGAGKMIGLSISKIDGVDVQPETVLNMIDMACIGGVASAVMEVNEMNANPPAQGAVTSKSPTG